MTRKALSYPPGFRELSCRALPEKCRFTVAGLAHPLENLEGDRFSDDAAADNFLYLQQHHYKALISFDSKYIEIVRAAAHQHNLKHLHYPIGDWDTPTVKQFDDIHSMVSSIKGKVAIHCLEGIGRTGTQLAALVLRHQINCMVAKKSFNKRKQQRSLQFTEFVAGSHLDDSSSSDSSDSDNYGFVIGRSDTRCTKLVKFSIEFVRHLRSPAGEANSLESIETAEEIKALCDYQEVLLERAIARQQEKTKLSKTLLQSLFHYPKPTPTTSDNRHGSYAARSRLIRHR
ncbi:MAG: protein-tyrosine phosphatase family protein [Coxiellaceae bacterium]|nr:protein-tyrosine phosphatase family protein [Coxiellaceae bacterium]